MANEKWFYKIHCFMIENLSLSGSELIIFAYIFGFANKGYHGSITNLINKTNLTKNTVKKALENLNKSNLIIKRIDGKETIYYANIIKIELLISSSKADYTMKELDLQRYEKVTKKGSEIDHKRVNLESTLIEKGSMLGQKLTEKGSTLIEKGSKIDPNTYNIRKETNIIQQHTNIIENNSDCLIADSLKGKGYFKTTLIDFDWDKWKDERYFTNTLKDIFGDNFRYQGIKELFKENYNTDNVVHAPNFWIPKIHNKALVNEKKPINGKLELL